ncbi:hypothetical protein CNMCM6106_007869 [Aspergillus hiratsukae]|uniref:Acetyl-CoA synthetase-like protein n=1 Tax=Aspergillus hiratsukae TaxID=1194566 RepID=A0A8H6PK65_9EURO|nr:hypothetical protein CNMCM6106_007869 [Aspergillus hiratsukae]
MIFSSDRPRLDIPTTLPIWDWLFHSPYSPLLRFPTSELAGFTNAATEETVRYDEVKEYTTLISTALVKKYGLKEGDTVALFAPNTIWYPVAMLATIRAGGVISGASPAYNVEEMTYALKTGRAKFLMTVPSSMGVAVPAAQNAGIPAERIFLLEGEKEGYATVQQLIGIGRGYASRQTPSFKIPAGKTNRDVCGFLSFSSGTTGLPKAVDQVTSPDRKKTLAVLPLFHSTYSILRVYRLTTAVTGLVHQMHLPILRNAHVYMLPSFTMDSMLATIVKYRIPEALLVPPIIIRLLRDPIVSNYDLSHLQTFSSGAAPISVELLQDLERRFPGTGFKQGYGMTESCSCITTHPPDKQTYRYAHTVGTIVPNTEVKIIDPSGRELGYNEPGEILARGPQVVMGYLGNEKATRETFDGEGWLHTGDVGFIDREGFITITDRIKEMIKVKGIGVSPAELEDLLLGHPVVEDVAVTSVPDEYSGERPKAYVVVKPGVRGEISGLDAWVDLGRRLIDYVREKKVRHKWIEEVEFVEEIPKSASGKILRRVLRDQGRSDDRVRGGSSHSSLTILPNNTVLFHAHLDITTLGGAGFASQRTTDDLSWDLSDADGLELGIAGSDGKVYTLILKDKLLPRRPDGRERSTISWEYNFRPAEKAVVRVKLGDLRATYRGREVEDAEPLDLKNVKRISIMIRIFFGTQDGVFSLDIASIAAFRREVRDDPRTAHPA